MTGQPNTRPSAPGPTEIDEEEAILAEVRAGRGVSHEAVRRWLLSKDTPHPMPRPQPGD